MILFKAASGFLKNQKARAQKPTNNIIPIAISFQPKNIQGVDKSATPFSAVCERDKLVLYIKIGFAEFLSKDLKKITPNKIIIPSET